MAQETQPEIPATVKCAPVADTSDLMFNFLGFRSDEIKPGDKLASTTDFSPQPRSLVRVADATDQTAAPTAAPMENARDHLTKLAGDMLNAGLMKQKDYDRIKSDMTDFDSRAAQAGMTADEISKTYENLNRIIEFSGQGPIDQGSRVKIAEQAMHHAAHPNLIDQGRHDTCNVTTVEVRSFMRYPAAATRLIADMATTGGATAADGTKIIIDTGSLKPDEESKQNPADDGKRSYASQLFQIAAANIFWQRRESDPAGNYATKGSLRFEQHLKERGYFGNDTGERLMEYYTNPPKVLAKGPAMGASDLKDIANQISGVNDDAFVIENKIKHGPNTSTVASEQDLKDVLANLKKTGQLPAIIRVHTGNEPFLTDQGGGLSRSKGVWHVVSITAYDEQTGKVTIDNQWGKNDDHTIKIDQLYNATMEPKGGAWQMIHESTMPTWHWHKHSPPATLPENEMWLH